MNRENFLTRLTKANWWQNPDVLIAVGVVTVVLMLIIPLPAILLDLFISLNLSLGVIILLTTMYVASPLEFSVFPTLLLITTIFGLALNISSTRLILSKGLAFDVQIIRAFGEFVVGGNYIIGFIVFVIILVVQFLVITRGSTRISEVAARFKLEEQPYRQMAIENEFNAGTINEQQKHERMDALQKEAQFYGAMDGASKFIQGNVTAGLIITAIAFVGGISIGMLQRGEQFSEALKTYTLFTIGDGLVSQLPALLISTATGIIITRAATKSNLSQELKTQLMAQPRAVLISAGILLVLAVLPGFPHIPLILLGGLMGSVGWIQMRNVRQKKEKEQQEEKQKEIQEKTKAMKPDDLMHLDPIELEIGYSLVPLADQESPDHLLERIAMIRRQTVLEYGLIIPPIRIRDNVKLDPQTYSILIKGVEMGTGRIKIGHYLAMESENVSEKIKGDPTTEPTFGLPAMWISEGQRQKAELAGYTVVDAPTIITTHLSEIIKNYGYELLGRREVKQMLDNVAKDHQVLVDEVLKTSGLNLGEIQKVLQKLLMERISIRDMISILETMADYAPKYKNNMDVITEYVRQSLKRWITNTYKSPDNTMNVIALDPEVEELMMNSAQEVGDEMQLTLDPKVMRAIINKTAAVVANVRKAGHQPIILTASKIRGLFRHMTQPAIPSLVVLSYNEIAPNVKVQTVDIVGFQKAAA